MRSAAPHRSSPRDRWLLVTDIDDTLFGDDEALHELLGRLAEAGMPLALNSSRPTASVQRSVEATWPSDAAPADAVITALGTEIEFAGTGRDEGWAARFAGWPRDEIDRIVRGLGFEAHAAEFQTPFKASFAVPSDERARVEAALDAAGIERRTIHSGATDFDVIPACAGKAEAMFHVAECLGVAPERVIVAGDSANDLVMFEAAERGIVVGNAREELRSRIDPSRAYVARASYAAGMLEALAHWQLIADRRER
jgi:sucrose-6F-phosphate phosphohydrolase